jgi:hypothetical protein
VGSEAGAIDSTVDFLRRAGILQIAVVDRDEAVDDGRQ